ncbi:Cytoplasmic FMR1-interacting protein [Strongyloides ratti]|uniref:Cytoplasmic FMR1-interacting protein n=1 Tax=Strongyloides ratti TaxID=34506 RepID=A0A090L966_STRRB|nr:Cytoplasmic FMR1-interacting protein [Strongyloides ratti]CEF64678.1 Cytoplasmic FMR1-interacting protein [Strongyloides ratti]
MKLENITKEDAILNVHMLNDLLINSNIPSIEGSSLPINCMINFDTKFEDKNAFIIVQSKFIEEASRYGELNNLLDDGFKYARMLYTWRCCTRAIPMAKSNDQINRNEMNKKIIEVLKPEVEKLYNFLDFINKGVSQFLEEVKRLSIGGKINDFISEGYLIMLGNILNMFIILDELKNMKSSIKNDFSTFKRAIQFLESDSNSLHQMQELSMFLAIQNKIKDDLRSQLQLINGYEELLCDIINNCVYLFENQMYLTPNEKHMLVNVISFSLYLIDSPNIILNKLECKKRIPINSIDKIFKSLTVVPLFGDMHIEPFSFIKKSINYDPSKWPLSNKEVGKIQVDITERVKIIRQQHDKYLAYFMTIKIEMDLIDKTFQNTNNKNQEITQLILSGIQLLSSWSSDVIETVSWKLLHPTNNEKNEECPGDAEEYERATKYNYNFEEKNALIEIIGMIKGLQKILLKDIKQFMGAINYYLYTELQNFVQVTLKEPLIKATKGKKDIIKRIILAIIETCADYNSNQSNQIGEQLIEKSKVKGKKKLINLENTNCIDNLSFSKKNVPPSTTQLYLTRTMLESLISERCGGEKKCLRKDIDHKHIDKMADFLKKSFYWRYLLNIEKYLFECCDLSQLWFREFYLEMTMGKRIQFPIEMSFPWILIDHILSNLDQYYLIQYILYQFDLYNDAAYFSLTKFKTKFLYDELESEVNLCFDQFIFKLSNGVFTHYKQVASSYLLDKKFKTKCKNMGIVIRSPEASRFGIILAQKNVQILGRYVNINKLVSQRINIAIYHSLDVAILNFESEPLIGIVKLEHLIDVNRICHELLKKHLPTLTDFNDILMEVNEYVTNNIGRIGLHIFYELNYDIFPNYCYNTTTRRFIKGSINFKKVPERIKSTTCDYQYEFGNKIFNAAIENISKMYSNFIGNFHLQIIVRLLDYQEIAIILKEFISIINLLLSGKLKEHINEVMLYIPKTCKLPLSNYGSSAVMEYYIHHTKDIHNYKEFYNGFSQQLRIFGNIFIFIDLLEEALSQEEVLDLYHTNTFTYDILRSNVTKNIEKDLQEFEKQYKSLNFINIVNLYGTEEQILAARESEILTNEKFSMGFNILEYFIKYVKDIVIYDTLFTGNYPTNGVMNVDECNEFYRLWSVVQFTICSNFPKQSNKVNEKKNNKNVDKLELMPFELIFGDGIHWGACILIYVLDQEHRFNVLDFSYHLEKIYKGEYKNKESKNINLKKIISRIHNVEQLNNQIFTFLRKLIDFKNCDRDIKEYPTPQYHNY